MLASATGLGAAGGAAARPGPAGARVAAPPSRLAVRARATSIPTPTHPDALRRRQEAEAWCAARLFPRLGAVRGAGRRRSAHA